MYVVVDGARLWVERDGDGPSVLVPTGGGVEFYRRTLSRRLRYELHVHFVEMRGTGGSTSEIEGATFASLADDLERVWQQLGLDRVVVLGHSNHGFIAVEHGLRHPTGCAGVVSVASVPAGRQAFEIGLERWSTEASPEQQADLASRQAAFAELDPSTLSADEYAVRRYLSFAPLAWRDPEMAMPAWGSVPFGAGAYFSWGMEMMPAYDATDRLAELKPPLLVISGRSDYLCPLETRQPAVETIPRC